MSSIIVALVVAAAAASGKHAVDHATVHVTKMNKTSAVEIYYPRDYANATAGSFPVVSFSHGKREGMSDTEPVAVPFSELIDEIVSQGVIVLAPQTCLAPKCQRASFDQLVAIDACRRHKKLHPALQKANFGATALVGHGLGGQHTERAARKIGFNIKAAVPMHTLPRIAWAKQAMVPTLYLTGTLDEEAPAAAIKKAYDANTQPGSRFANLVGAGHYEPTHYADGRLNRYVAAFVRCHTVADKDACDVVEDMCSEYNFEECSVKVAVTVSEEATVTSKQKVQKSCPICMAYFFVLLFFLFCCFFPTCTNERMYGK